MPAVRTDMQLALLEEPLPEPPPRPQRPARPPWTFHRPDDKPILVEQHVSRCECQTPLTIHERVHPYGWVLIYKLSRAEHEPDCVIRNPTRANREAAIRNAFAANDLRGAA